MGRCTSIRRGVIFLCMQTLTHTVARLCLSALFDGQWKVQQPWREAGTRYQMHISSFLFFFSFCMFIFKPCTGNAVFLIHLCNVFSGSANSLDVSSRFREDVEQLKEMCRTNGWWSSAFLPFFVCFVFVFTGLFLCKYYFAVCRYYTRIKLSATLLSSFSEISSCKSAKSVMGGVPADVDES